MSLYPLMITSLASLYNSEAPLIMDYSKLISPKRRKPTDLVGRSLTEELASDRSRVIYSPPFRRLSQKAQVFSLENNAAVRNRVTHSLEVSDVGRLIAYGVTEELIKGGRISRDFQLPIMYAVETACLLHDIGNPPFGHFGEAAIREWFEENWERCYKRSKSIPSERSLSGTDKIKNLILDFLEFDGNPQGLRIVLRLQRHRDEYGLNLTATTILSLIKYVRSSSEEKGDGLKKKPGYFESEKEIIKDIKSSIGLPGGARYPLAYIMEAADDIAYCISDIEDGIEKRILTPTEFFKELEEEWARINNNDTTVGPFPFGDIDNTKEEKFRFFKFKTSYTRQAIQKARDLYLEHESKLFTGDIASLFVDGTKEAKAIKCLKNVARRRLFRSPEAENPELAGYKIITGLLNAFERLLTCSEDEFTKLLKSKEDPTVVTGQGLDLHWRLFNKLPKKHVRAYQDQVKQFQGRGVPEWFLRAHLVVDFISGMTDGFALELYRLFHGIKLK